MRREYARWGDPASLIVPDPEQAARVDRAIRFRMREGSRALAPASLASPSDD